MRTNAGSKVPQHLAFLSRYAAALVSGSGGSGASSESGG